MNKRFTEEQILAFLCEADMGVPVRQLCDKHGFSERSYYQWRSRIVGAKTSLAQYLAHLESENLLLRQVLVTKSLLPPMLEPEPLQWPELTSLPESHSSTRPEESPSRQRTGPDWSGSQHEEAFSAPLSALSH